MNHAISAADWQELERRAREAACRAYAPYSHFRVAAALLCADGTMACGVNVENRSYGLTMCAERVAVGNAISQGQTEFRALFLYCPDSATPVPPCGACRQVLSEFAAPQMPVRYCGRDGAVVEKTMAELLPLDSLHDLRGKELSTKDTKEHEGRGKRR
jgi:cytidine deaminase